jgi:hypothetical protein
VQCTSESGPSFREVRVALDSGLEEGDRTLGGLFSATVGLVAAAQEEIIGNRVTR